MDPTATRQSRARTGVALTTIRLRSAPPRRYLLEAVSERPGQRRVKDPGMPDPPLRHSAMVRTAARASIDSELSYRAAAAAISSCRRRSARPSARQMRSEVRLGSGDGGMPSRNG